MPAKISDRYVDKISAISLLLLGGVKPKDLKKWYLISDAEITQARKKVEELNLMEVKAHD
jgi:hypothetical protein